MFNAVLHYYILICSIFDAWMWLLSCVIRTAVFNSGSLTSQLAELKKEDSMNSCFPALFLTNIVHVWSVWPHMGKVEAALETLASAPGHQGWLQGTAATTRWRGRLNEWCCIWCIKEQLPQQDGGVAWMSGAVSDASEKSIPADPDDVGSVELYLS